MQKVTIGKVAVGLLGAALLSYKSYRLGQENPEIEFRFDRRRSELILEYRKDGRKESLGFDVESVNLEDPSIQEEGIWYSIEVRGRISKDAPIKRMGNTLTNELIKWRTGGSVKNLEQYCAEVPKDWICVQGYETYCILHDYDEFCKNLNKNKL